MQHTRRPEVSYNIHLFAPQTANYLPVVRPNYSDSTGIYQLLRQNRASSYVECCSSLLAAACIPMLDICGSYVCFIISVATSALLLLQFT